MNNPNHSLEGKPCKYCGKPATHFVLDIVICAACADCAREARGLGSAVVAPVAASDGAK